MLAPTQAPNPSVRDPPSPSCVIAENPAADAVQRDISDPWTLEEGPQARKLYLPIVNQLDVHPAACLHILRSCADKERIYGKLGLQQGCPLDKTLVRRYGSTNQTPQAAELNAQTTGE